jgi:hypothetical protein
MTGMTDWLEQMAVWFGVVLALAGAFVLGRWLVHRWSPRG